MKNDNLLAWLIIGGLISYWILGFEFTGTIFSAAILWAIITGHKKG